LKIVQNGVTIFVLVELAFNQHFLAKMELIHSTMHATIRFLFFGV